MTAKAIKKLTKLSQTLLFVPVTTRTIEQYKRIEIFRNEVKPRYSVTSNGGNILYDGEPVHEWNRQVQAEIGHECLPVNDLLQQFKELTNMDWLLTEKMADELFYYCVVNRELLPQEEISAFGNWANDQGWHLSIQGRKIYLVPHMVSKARALQYIRERESVGTMAAAGDSLLDLEMLLRADYALVPPHGELFRSFCNGSLNHHKLNFTQAVGIASSEEILESVEKYFRNRF